MVSGRGKMVKPLRQSAKQRQSASAILGETVTAKARFRFDRNLKDIGADNDGRRRPRYNLCLFRRMPLSNHLRPAMKRFKRKQLLVDRQVQGAFVWRAVGYWVMCLITVVLLLTFTEMIAAPAQLLFPEAESSWFRIVPTVVCALCFLPVIVYDFLQLSNRLVGPLVRLRRGMRALGEGQHVQPIKFRDGDFWRDFADEFNAVARRVHDAGGCCGPQSSENAAAELATAGQPD